MRIWYVVGTAEYWLEPQYSRMKNGRLRFLGCRLYDRTGTYKGYWQWNDIPAAVQRTVRDDVTTQVKRDDQKEKYELQAIQMLKRRPKGK